MFDSSSAIGPNPMSSAIAASDAAKSAQAMRQLSQAKTLPSENAGSEPMREAFQDFVGQTLFGSLLASMRSTTGKSAYMHGGRGEEIFQKQMDQHLVQNLSDSSASSLADPMFELFNMQRQA